MIAQRINASAETSRTRIEDEMVGLYRDLRARAYALTKDFDAANDLVQQACERGLRMKSSIGPETNTAAWLKCVIRNLFVDEYRGRRKYAPLQCDPEAECSERRAPAFADLLTLEDAKAGIHAMRDEDRVILELALLEGLAYRDIAVRLGLLPKTVGTRLFRAKAKLRKHLQPVHEARLATLMRAP